MIDPAAHARLDGWKQSLLDSNDPLLDLADAGLAVRGDPVRLAFVLGAGGGLELDGDERLIAPLRRAARDARGDGDHVLWLALGLLAWERGRLAPVVLWPVELAADGRLVSAAGRTPRLNDVLAQALRTSHDSTLELAGELDLAEVLRAAGAIADAHADWRLERAARLAICSFARFELWRDLDGRDLLASAPVAWLAGSAARPELPAPATDLVAPLDADASQLAAIAAAAAGGSFVVQGPPGTGKSQTIANIVVDCASRGKTVLVVSDRAAALDIVHKRLTQLGLGDFCAALHGAPAAVIDTLGRVLDRAFRPGAGPSTDPARLGELRAALDTHRAALHDVGAFGMSPYEVLARLVELRTTPRAALAERDAPILDRGMFARRFAAVGALAAAARAVEPVAAHPWRAATFETWSYERVARAKDALDESRAAVEQLAYAVADVCALVPKLHARTPDELRALGALAELAARSPRPGAELLTAGRGTRGDEIGEKVALIRARGTGSLDTPRDPAEFVAIAARHRALACEIDETFTEAVATLDAPALWTQLKRWTASMAPLRYVALRAARAEVRAAARPGTLVTDEALLVALEAVIAERACRAALEAAAEPARRWFGELGASPLALDLAAIDAAVAWGGELRRTFDRVAVAGGEVGRQVAWRALVAQVASSADSPSDLRPFARLAEAVARWSTTSTELAEATGIAPALLGAGPDHLTALREQLAVLHAAADSLADWARYYLARRDAIVAGVGPAVAVVERGDLAADDLAGAWERATLLAWLDAEVRSLPALAHFDGGQHHIRVTSFGDLDRGALGFARTRAIGRLVERVPRVPRGSEDAEPAALRREVVAERKGSLRALLAQLPTLLPKLAPCMLATPHALAEHLDASIQFDVVVFDEASRLPVAHALGALARARSVVVVGDSRQPAPASGTEGLLAAALAAKLPELALSRHYRSRHEDLFAFANRHYYGDRIELLPAPHGEAIALRRIDGHAELAGDNRAEAYAIVDEVCARLRDPARRERSLAIVTMSRAQQHLIEDLITAARLRDGAIAAALDAHAEPLLVGTPDRVQGEERDDAIVSIGGTADTLGALALPGSDSWLAVATTRARDRMLVFASLDPEHVADDAAPPARDLAELLAFARAGGGASRVIDDAPPASAVTAAIARALGERGWTVRHRVGCGAYRIALAVLDPDDPNRYVLAIEDDGAAYGTAPAARDRDRLRPQLLAQLGWRVHRMWSLDWWSDAEREIQRAHGAIVAAIAAGRQGRVTSAPIANRLERRSAKRIARGSAPVPQPSPEHAADTMKLASGSGPLEIVDGVTTPIKIPRGAIAIGPYVAASIPAGRRAPDDIFAPRHLAELGKIVEQVIAAEAPVHVDVLARRVGAYFGIGRITPEVTNHLRGVLAGRGRWGDEQGIVWKIDQDPAGVPGVRVAGAGASARRDIAEVPLAEVAAAARIVVERAHDVSATDLVRDCARLLGFARITDQVSERVSHGVQLAAGRALITIVDGRAKMPA